MSRASLEVGATGSAAQRVDPADLASALAGAPGEAYPPVFATSRMVALMERAAAAAMRPLLASGELSVGVQVDVQHSAPTPAGATVRAEARFVGMEGKLYAFEVTASDGAGPIGRGRHTRAIVVVARLLAGAARRA
jgi:fluoroacetyl-CoA thioesterase